MYLNDIFNINSNDQHHDDDDDDLYGILGCHPSCTSEQILSEYRSLALQHHPDKAHSPADRMEREHRFRQLSRAKQVLTDPQMRRDYDRWRESGISMSYKRWSSLSQRCTHSSIHWKNSANRNRAIQPAMPTEQEEETGEQHTRSYHTTPHNVQTFRQQSIDNNASILNMFRNYQI